VFVQEIFGVKLMAEIDSSLGELCKHMLNPLLLAGVPDVDPVT
jgi:hypothetical protein